MADYRREQDLREEAMFDKNELIRELEMEVARATSVLQSKSSEMNETKSKLVEAQEKAEKNESSNAMLGQMFDLGALVQNEDGSISIAPSQNGQ